MNVRDLHIIHANLVTMMLNKPSFGTADDAYGWTRLLCRQLRPLTLKTNCTGTEEWFDVA